MHLGVLLMFIGVDCEEIERFGFVNETFIEHVFSNEEISYCTSKKNPAEHFAARFAAKEAVVKALGQAGITESVELREISIRNTPEGVPEIIFLNGLSEAYNCRLSLAHSGNMAIAFVLLIPKH